MESLFGLAPLNADFHWYARHQMTIDATTPGYGADSPMTRAIFADRAIVQCYEPLQLYGQVDPAKPLVLPKSSTAITVICGCVVRGAQRTR